MVGAGSAGAAAAGGLVGAGFRVLLLEAGGDDDNPAIQDPARAHELWFAPEDWGYRTAPQAHAADRRLHWPRGKVLGGSSSLNGLIYVRGAPADFDHWAYLGNAGWGWDDVLAVYRRMEDGPVEVLRRYRPAAIHEAIVAAAVETGIPFNEDYNSGELDGVSQVQLTVKDGRRLSAAGAYLSPLAGSPDLSVVTEAHARRLLFDGSRCTGVEWTRAGRVESAHATTEVVVCAGTIESPRLLMLSGIGPGAHLREHGLPVVCDLPGVGANLHDHLLVPLIFSAEREIGPPQEGFGPAQSHLFWRSRGGLAAPDIQPIHFMVPLYEDWMEGPEDGFSLMAGMIRPASRGSIRLSGPDPDDELVIDPRVLSCEADLEALEAAVRLCREIGQATPLREWGARELYPGGAIRTDADLRDYVRRAAITYHHQVGTCKMGVDEQAVVDARLRVHGVDGLRVADASIMPAVISGNTNGPALMIGERVADFVAADQAGARAQRLGSRLPVSPIRE